MTQAMSTSVGFMESPLVLWLQTFRPNDELSYKDIYDGAFLNDIMHEIDPRATIGLVVQRVQGVRQRIQNWDVLMKNIKAYYKDVLQQLIVMQLPNIMAISREPETDGARRELQRVLLLVLGCAVQCEQKEAFIENIRHLNIDVQQAIVEHIQEITEDHKNVFSIELPDSDQLPELTQVIFTHLRTALQERDGYMEDIKELTQNLEDLYQTQHQMELNAKRPATPPSVNSEKHHLAVELAELKAKMRKMRQELEEKSELAAELSDELEEHKTLLAKLRNENLELVQEARSARTYRDEVDILKEKASRVDKFEVEVTKYKEKLHELEFYKTRVDELRDDNAIMTERTNMLEDQLSTSQKRLETVIDLENELMRYKGQIEEMAASRDKDRAKINELVEENARLEFEKKSSFNESATLEEELIRARSQLNSGMSNSISEQLNETANGKVLRLELENSRLQKRIEEIRDKEVFENTSRVLELEKENNRLAKKVEKLQEATSKESQQYIQMEQLGHELHREKEELQETLETVKENAERQVAELEREKDQLAQQIETLRERNEKTHDSRMKEIEKENKRMHENVKNMSGQCSRLEYENRQLQKSYERLRENVNRIREVEEENQKIEKQNDDLHKNIATLQLTCDKFEKLEQESCDLEVENHKLERMVATLKGQVSKMEALEQDNINLNVEVQHLRRTLENAKNSNSKMAGLEHEKEEKEREVQQLKKALDATKAEKTKQEQLEIDLLDFDTENQKLQRNLEAMSRRADELDRESQELESQNDKLQKTIESMKMSMRKLEELEKENNDLEVENTNLNKEKSSTDKENKRLKQQIERKEASLDEVTTKLSILEKENKSLKKNYDKTRDYASRLRELEKENQEMLQQGSMDKKTLSTLREDLVNEKIMSQQLNNELEKLTQELERVGLNKEQLISAQEDESKYKALENMMEDAFRNTMQIKEEKIYALESRLTESKSRNMQLQDQIKSIKCDYEALQQRREEEVLVSSSNEKDSRRSSSTRSSVLRYPNATKDILELKDHLITVERTNATLEAENKNLRDHMHSLQDRVGRAESTSTTLQAQFSQYQGQNNSLQSQLAKIQVENTTLQSQNATLVSQNASLQKQHAHLENDHDKLMSSYEDVQSNQSSLSADHESLQKLHEQLTVEYEVLISEHGTLKSNHKLLRNDLKELQEQHAELRREKDMLTELKRSIEEDRASLKTETKSMGSLQLDMIHIREENIRLKSNQEKQNKEYRELLQEHKSVKNEYNQLQLKHTELQGNFNDCRDQLNNLDVEISKMASRCEALSQLNTKLEEENRTLMMQLQALLNQNQELLTKSLENKDHFHEEERAYMEKLSELRRQKEKLEEKIMDQYKRYDPVKRKNRSFGANLVRKARGFISRANREKSRERRSSVGDGLSDSPRLAKKKFAQSTTALNLLQSSEKDTSNFSLRGAKSSENLLMETPKSSKGRAEKDSDSLSSSNSSHRNTEWPARPARRRTLLDSMSSGGALYASGGRGSQSSEDAHNAQRESSLSTPRSRASRASAEDSEEEISLEQFLTESNRSPASRRKLLLNKKIDPDSLNQEDLETTPAPPPSFLTPRSPIVEKEDTQSRSRSNTPGPERKKILSSSKSESTLSHLAKQNSGSSLGSYGERPDIPTSTPKFPSSQSQNTLLSMSRPHHGGERSPGGHMDHSGSHRANQNSPYLSRSNNTIDTRTAVLPPTPDYIRNQQMNSFNHGSSPAGSSSSSSSLYSDVRQMNNSNHSNTFQLQQPPAVVRQNSRKASEPGPARDNAYNSLPRKVSAGTTWQNGGATVPRQNTNGGQNNSSSYGDYMPMDGGHSGSSEQLDSRNDQRFTMKPYDDTYGTAPPRNTSMSNGPSRPDGDRNYTPNVRNMVQNYQGMQPREPPVPPPRRSRPVTPGPSSQSRPITPGPGNQRRAVTPGPELPSRRPITPAPLPPTMNNTSSQSYVPRSSVAPSYTTINISTGVAMVPSNGSNYNNNRNSNSNNSNPNLGRTLPLRPDESRPTNTMPRPGSTPPKPPVDMSVSNPNNNQEGNNTQPGGKKPNSVWYEYGCV